VAAAGLSPEALHTIQPPEVLSRIGHKANEAVLKRSLALQKPGIEELENRFRREKLDEIVVALVVAAMLERGGERESSRVGDLA
jgi:hypothetical protein